MNNKNIEQNNLAAEQEISLLPLFKIILRKRWFIFLFLILGIAFGVLITFFIYKPKYEAEGALLLQTPEKVKQDIVAPVQQKYTQSDIVQSSYSTVIDSRSFMEKLVQREYLYSADGRKVATNLVDFYKSEDLDDLIDYVAKQLKQSYDKKTFVLKFSYISSSPEISAQIVNNAIEQLNEFYLNEFNSNSKRNLEFVNQQLADAKKTLDKARKDLTSFIRTNKQLQEMQNKPLDQYAFQEAKTQLKNLQDDVDIKEKFYNSLLSRSQSLGLDASQTAPSVIILQKAFPPAKPMPPKYIRNGVILGFLFFVFSVILVIVRNIGEITGPGENIVTLLTGELRKDLTRLRLIKKPKV